MIWDNNEDIRIDYCDATRRDIQRTLDACREERRPYVIVTPKTQGLPSHVQSILVPVSMLEEEIYKAEICTYLARKTGAHLILLRANDYGSKALHNTQRIISHIQTISQRTGISISYEERLAKGDSFHIHKEIHLIASSPDSPIALTLLTASREYGVDDWLFGPPEQYVIRHSSVPVMLVNPRADLFSLCD
jgi:nucleotide-binding universal stress UspA family protein